MATTVVLLLAVAGGALADSATISVTTTTGAFDPVAGVPRIITVSGVASTPERVYVKYRATGGAPCAQSSSSDPGTVVGGFYAESVNGSFSLQDVIDWATPGAVTFCTWLSGGDAATITTPIAQTIAFRAPKGAIGVTMHPAKLRPGEQAAIVVSGSTEAAAAVYAKVRTAGSAPCGRTYAAEAGSSLLDGTPATGAFSLDLTTTEAKAGSYLACVWIARSASDPSPIAGPGSVAFSVAARAVCVVPSLGRDRRPATVRLRIRTAHCRVGRTVRIPSRTVRKGAVIRLGRRAHTRLAAGTAIGVVVSSGPPSQRRRQR
jgi:hypothetical protein